MTKILYTDLDPFACAVVRQRVRHGALAYGDVLEKDIRHVRPDDVVRYQQVHLFCGIAGIPLGLQRAGVPDDFPIWSGGFPCQDLSVAGKGAGISKGTRSGLWREMFRLIRHGRPAWLLIENVPALRNRGYDRVYDALARLGYELGTVVVGAEHVGAPHKRHRVWIVGRLGLADTNRDGIGNADELRRVERSGGAGTSDAGRGGAALAHAGRSGLEIGSEPEVERRNLRDKGETAPQGRSRILWPSRPGEPQHEWEHPRLIRFDLGNADMRDSDGNGPASDEGETRLEDRPSAYRDTGHAERSVGAPVDELSPRLVRAARRHNRKTLKAAGNAVVVACVEVIGRAILDVEEARP
jgi:DNA (cytosine-5)-methyltransferase 1